jgi:hypothetical protein
MPGPKTSQPWPETPNSQVAASPTQIQPRGLSLWIRLCYDLALPKRVAVSTEKPLASVPADRIPSVLPCPKCQTLTAKAVKIHGVSPEVQYYRCEPCAYLWSVQGNQA